MSTILKPYEYLYYRLYAWNLRVWGEGDMPQFNALFGVSFLSFLNIYCLIGISRYLVGVNLFEITNWGKFHAILLGTIILSLGFLIFISGQRYQVLFKQFHREPPDVRRRNLVLCILYAVISVVLFFCMNLPN
jgi:hypothetical protein